MRKAAERCEQTTKPSRELDLDIQEALGFQVRRVPDYIFKATRTCGMFLDERQGEANRWVEAPRYTASLDAAMTLLDDRQWTAWELRSRNALSNYAAEISRLGDDKEEELVRGRARTPALALCTAALRARDAIATEARRAETVQLGSVHEGAGRQASPKLPIHPQTTD